MSMEMFRKRKIEDFSDFRLKQMKKNVPSEFMCLELSGVHNWAPQYSRKRSKNDGKPETKTASNPPKYTRAKATMDFIAHFGNYF